MPKFRKKPVIIDAIQWDGKNFDAVMNFMGETCGHKKAYEDYEEQALRTGQLVITTMHNGQNVVVEPGDWIIPDGKPNTFYPCKPDVFERTYEAVEDATISDLTELSKNNQQ